MDFKFETLIDKAVFCFHALLLSSLSSEAFETSNIFSESLGQTTDMHSIRIMLYECMQICIGRAKMQQKRVLSLEATK